MRLPSLLVLAGLVAAAALGMVLTEPDPAPGIPGSGTERTAAEAGQDLDTRTATADADAPGPNVSGQNVSGQNVSAPVDVQPAPQPVSAVQAARPPQTCGLVARENVIGAVVFRAGPESLVVTAADLIRSTPLALDDSQWGVSIELCPEAAQEMAAFSERRIGEQVQILSSGTLLSAPVLRNAIRDGRLTLTGGFDRARAQEIADEIAGRSG